MKILSSVMFIIILLGITATSLSNANFIDAQNNQVDIIMPQRSGISNTQPIIDLNEQEKTTLTNLLLECPSGLFVYTGINKQIVIACLIDGAYGKLFNNLGQEIIDIRINVDNDNDNDNNNGKDDDNDNGNNGPDRDCLFDPSLPKCASVDGECPDGFFQNGYEQCVPDHRDGCPDGYHSVDDDETGKCIPNSEGCPPGMEFRPDGKSCTYIEEEEEEQQEEENGNDRDCGNRGNFTMGDYEQICNEFDNNDTNMTMSSNNNDSDDNNTNNDSNDTLAEFIKEQEDQEDSTLEDDTNNKDNGNNSTDNN